jgi:hypothetical protein
MTTKVLEFGLFAGVPITSIFMPRTITSIRSEAFLGCQALDVVAFESRSHLMSFGRRAFSHSSLPAIFVPDSVLFLDSELFAHCRHLKAVTFAIESRVASLSSMAFLGCGLSYLQIPKSVQTCDSHCFSQSEIRQLDFEMPAQIREFGHECLSHCKLETVCYPATVAVLGSSAWILSPSVGRVTFHKGSVCTFIAMSAFSSCGIISIVIPPAVRSIEAMAFAGCRRLIAVDFESGSCLISIRDKAFWNSSLPYIAIPSSTEEIAASAFGHCKLLSIGVSSNPHFSVFGGFLIRRADRCALRYFGRVGTVVLPDEVQAIGDYCFSSCETVKCIRSSPALAAIGQFAFAASTVAAVYIPEKAVIDALAFRESNARPFSASPDLQIETSFMIHENVLCGTFQELARLTIPRNVQIIAGSCFAKSRSIRIVEFEEDSELLRIEDRAFAVSSLESIAIPNKVEVLGEGVFDYCVDLSQFSFQLPSAIRTIGAACFDRTDFPTIYIPETTEFIGARAFMDSKLRVLSLGNAKNRQLLIDNNNRYWDIKRKQIQTYTLMLIYYF